MKMSNFIYKGCIYNGIINLVFLASHNYLIIFFSKKEEKKKNNVLTDAERDKLEGLLRSLLPDRNPVAETMVWCIEHAEAGEEVVECISESLGILQTPLTKKIARLYLISDILHNCSVKGVPNVSYYRKGFQVTLKIFVYNL